MSNLPLFVPSNSSTDVTITFPNSSNIDASVVKYGHILQNTENTSKITPWLDTKLFPIVNITSSLSTDASASIYWGIGEDDDVPNSYALTKDTITSSNQTSTEWDTRARWARIHLNGVGELSYQLKPSATGIKIVDDNGSIVSVTSNAMQIVYRDASGVLGSTDKGGAAGDALYTSLTDSTGQPLNKYLDTLTVAIRDNCGENLDRTDNSGTQTISGKLYYGSNALNIATSDICGHAQAGITQHISPAFGTVASAYALADVSGVQIGTTNSDIASTNALYVTLTDGSGDVISTSNELPVALGGDVVVGLIMDSSVGDVMTRYIDINDADISGHGFNLKSLGLCNETATPVWFKIYDTHQGLATYAEETNDYSSAQNTLKFNIAVPGLSTRDVRFEKGVIFKHGLAARAATLHNYDSSTNGNLGAGVTQAYISTNYEKATLTTAQVTANVAARPTPELDDIRRFDIDRNGVTLRGYINNIRDDNGLLTKVLFMPLEATGLDPVIHEDIQLFSYNMANLSIGDANIVYGTSLYNSPLIAGEPKLYELTTPTDISCHTIRITLDGFSNFYADIHTIAYTDTDTSVTSFIKYGDDGFLSIALNSAGSTVISPQKVTGGVDTDISQVDMFFSGVGNVAPLNGSSTHVSTTLSGSALPYTNASSSQIDLSAYLITYDASVYIVDSNSTATDQYDHAKAEFQDASTNRMEYFGISGDSFTDASNWCFSTPDFVGHVHHADSFYRTTIARMDRDVEGVGVDVSYYVNDTQTAAVTASVVDYSNGIRVSYYDSEELSTINRFTISGGSFLYDFSLEDLGGGTKFIYYTSRTSL